MPKGSCNPAPAQFNVVETVKGSGDVIVTVRWSWDGVSVFPNCAGPVFDAHVRNVGAVTWYAHFARRQGGFRTVAIAPADDRTVTQAQLNAVGLVTVADVQAVRLSRSSDPLVN